MKIKSRNGASRFHSTSYRTGNRRGGSVIVIVALSMVALCGFGALAVDYGVLVSDANRLQRAADAAALAGAEQLKKTGFDATDTANARSVASNVVAQNGIANFDSSAISFSATGDRITVPTTTRRNFFFAPVFRLIDSNSATSGQISRRASAGVKSLTGVPSVSPLAITTTDYYKYKDGTSFTVKQIRNHEEGFDAGEVVAMDLRLGNNGKSGAMFEDDVRDGVDRTAEIGEENNALNSSINSQGNKLLSAMDSRLTRALLAPWYDNGSKYTFPNYPSDDPRVMTIVVANPSPQDNSNPMIKTEFFVTVYIESIGTVDGAPRLTMRILPSNLFSSDRSDIIVGNNYSSQGSSVVVGLID